MFWICLKVSNKSFIFCRIYRKIAFDSQNRKFYGIFFLARDLSTEQKVQYGDVCVCMLKEPQLIVQIPLWFWLSCAFRNFMERRSCLYWTNTNRTQNKFNFLFAKALPHRWWKKSFVYEITADIDAMKNNEREYRLELMPIHKQMHKLCWLAIHIHSVLVIDSQYKQSTLLEIAKCWVRVRNVYVCVRQVCSMCAGRSPSIVSPEWFTFALNEVK